MKFQRNTLVAAAALAAALCGSNARADLGDFLIVKNNGNVILTFEGSSAGFDSTLSVNGGPQIFPNHSTATGTTYDLGYFEAGTILDAALFVSDGNIFHSGPGSLNADGFAHALVIDNWNGTGRTYVGFEDIFGTANGQGDYDDHTFSFSNTFVSSTPDTPTVPAVPEPETYALMLAGLGVTGWFARRRRSAERA